MNTTRGLIVGFGLLTGFLLVRLNMRMKRMVTKTEFQARLAALDVRLGKAKAEIVKEIQTLKDQLSDADVSDEAAATLERLEAKAGELDGLNDDEAASGDDTGSSAGDDAGASTGADETTEDDSGDAAGETTEDDSGNADEPVGVVGDDAPQQPEGSETPGARKSGE